MGVGWVAGWIPSVALYQRDFLVGEAVEVTDEAVDLPVGGSVGRW